MVIVDRNKMVVSTKLRMKLLFYNVIRISLWYYAYCSKTSTSISISITSLECQPSSVNMIKFKALSKILKQLLLYYFILYLRIVSEIPRSFILIVRYVDIACTTKYIVNKIVKRLLVSYRLTNIKNSCQIFVSVS